MNLILLGILFYVVLQLVVGVVVSRRIQSESDYLVAGRKIGLGLALFSMFATWFGAETCVGAAGKFYAEGFAGGVSDPFGYTLVLLLVGWFIARPLWSRGLTTLADLFRQRFGQNTERFASLIMIPTSVLWAAAQIRAFGIVLHSAGGVDLTTGMLIATVVVIIYTCSGGLLADVMTDLIQGIAIIIGLGLLLLSLGMNPAINLAIAWQSVEPARFNLFGGEASVWQKADLWLNIIIGSLVAQELAARILGARSPDVAAKAATYGGMLYLTVGLIPALLGLLGPTLLPGLADPETFLPALAQKYLPPFLFMLFAGALVSAILSTVDSALLAASSLASHNFIVSFRPDLGDRQRLLLARGGVVLLGLVSALFAMSADSIFELVQHANGVGSAGIFALLVFGLYAGNFGGPRAGLATLAVGLVTWIHGTFFTDWSAPYLCSLVASLTTFVVAAKLERSTAAEEVAAGAGITK
jgi:SSS family transporter